MSQSSFFKKKKKKSLYDDHSKKSQVHFLKIVSSDMI